MAMAGWSRAASRWPGGSVIVTRLTGCSCAGLSIHAPRPTAMLTALEALTGFAVRGEMGSKQLERDQPIQARVATFVDLAHASRAERREDFIGPKPCAGFKRHRFLIRAARASKRWLRLGANRRRQPPLPRGSDSI
jgi:hypothetical protein